MRHQKDSTDLLSTLFSGLSLDEGEAECGSELLPVRHKRKFSWDPETSTLLEDGRSVSEMSLWTESGQTLADEDRAADDSDSEAFYDAQDLAAAPTAVADFEVKERSGDLSDSSNRLIEDKSSFGGGRRAAGVLGVMPESAASETLLAQELEVEEPRGRSLSSPRHEPAEAVDIQKQPKVRWYAKELQALLGDARHAHFRTYFNGIGSEGFSMPGTADLEREFPGVDFTVRLML
jgi:hypothetical protein